MILKNDNGGGFAVGFFVFFVHVINGFCQSVAGIDIGNEKCFGEEFSTGFFCVDRAGHTIDCCGVEVDDVGEVHEFMQGGFN